MPQNPETVGSRLSRYLRQAGLSQQDFAGKLGFSPSYLTRIIQGGRRMTPELASAFARATNIPAEIWIDLASVTMVPKDWRGGSVLTNKQIVTAIDMGLIKIDPFLPDEGQLQPAGYDLSRGEFQYPGSHTLLNSRKMVLQPNQSVLVYSREKIRLSKRVVGFVGGRNELNLHHVANFFSQRIEPGLESTPFAHLRNFGQDPFELMAGDVFATVSFSLLSEDALTKSEPSEQSQQPTGLGASRN